MEGVSLMYVEGVDAEGVNVVDLKGVDVEGVNVVYVGDVDVCTLYNRYGIYIHEVFGKSPRNAFSFRKKNNK